MKEMCWKSRVVLTTQISIHLKKSKWFVSMWKVEIYTLRAETFTGRHFPEKRNSRNSAKFCWNLGKKLSRLQK